MKRNEVVTELRKLGFVDGTRRPYYIRMEHPRFSSGSLFLHDRRKHGAHLDATGALRDQLITLAPPTSEDGRYPYWRNGHLKDLLAAMAPLPEFAANAATETAIDVNDVEIVSSMDVAKRLRIHPGRELTSEAAWEVFAPPARGKSQWREGYSAREFARRWLDSVNAHGNVPSEIRALLDTQECTRGFAGVHA